MQLVESVTRPSKGGTTAPANDGLVTFSLTLLLLHLVGNKDAPSLVCSGELLTPWLSARNGSAIRSCAHKSKILHSGVQLLVSAFKSLLL